MKKKKNSLLPKILFLVFLSFQAFTTIAQNISVKGKVYNQTSNTLIEAASIIIQNGDAILAYDYTDENGNYSIDFQRPETSQFTIEANSLGFSGKVITIDILPNKNSYQQEIYLSEKIESLSTVVLRPDEKIKIDRDTISFKVSAFKDDTERTVEDILKKMPGIEVSEDGNIKALGKPIQKILIEGDDLADSNYKVISQNLNVDVIDKIDIVSNYDENPVLKQFLNSENVVLNLRLKDKKKSILFGNARVGGGIENRFLGDANIGVINPLVKFLDLANTNNTGKSANGQFNNYNFSYNGSNFNDFSKDFNIRQNPVVYLSGSAIALDDKNYIENTTFANNLLINKRFNDSLKLRNSTYFYYDNFQKEYRGNYRYFVEPNDIFFTESNKFDLSDLNLSNDLSLNYSPSKNTHIVFKNVLTLLNQTNKNRLVFNGENIDQRLKNKQREIESQLQLTRKVKNGAMVIDLFMGSKKNNQDFLIEPNTFLKDSLQNNTSLKNNYQTSLDYQGIDAAIVLKKNKTSYSFTTGLVHLNESLNSISTAFKENEKRPIDTLSGRNNTNSLAPHLQFKLESEILKNLFFDTDLDGSLNFYDKNDFSETFFLPNAATGISLRKTKAGAFRVRYRYKEEIPRLRYFNDNLLVKSYRSLSLGVRDVSPLKSNQYFFGYNFSRIKKRIFLDASISYTRFENQFSFRDNVNQDLDISQIIYVPGEKILFFRSSFATYIDEINSTAKFGYQQQFSEKPITINGQNALLKNSTSSYYLTGTTYLKGSLNFKVLANYTINKGRNGTNEVTNERYNFELQTVLKISEDFVAKLESEAFIIASEFYETNNLSIDYTPKEKNWNFGLQVQNLFDTNEYIFQNSSEFVQTTNFFTAVPRYVTLFYEIQF